MSRKGKQMTREPQTDGSTVRVDEYGTEYHVKPVLVARDRETNEVLRVIHRPWVRLTPKTSRRGAERRARLRQDREDMGLAE